MSHYLACVTNDIPDVRPCTIRDEHYAACDGIERRYRTVGKDEKGRPVYGTVETGRECRGCVEEPAKVGVTCMRCWRALELAWSEWELLEEPLSKYARLSPRNSDGRRGVPGPSVPLPQTYLAVDEVRSWLRDEPQDARSWVSTVEGAQHAVGFTRAVQRAARAHQIEERARQLQRMRCPECAQIVAWMPPRYVGDEVSVECDGCGRRITETEQWAAYRRTGDQERPWEKYQEAAIDVIAQIETRRKA